MAAEPATFEWEPQEAAEEPQAAGAPRRRPIWARWWCIPLLLLGSGAGLLYWAASGWGGLLGRPRVQLATAAVVLACAGGLWKRYFPEGLTTEEARREPQPGTGESAALAALRRENEELRRQAAAAAGGPPAGAEGSQALPLRRDGSQEPF